MGYLLEVQRKRNMSTSQHWDLYEGHRSHVMSLLKEIQVGGNGRICILGAGNCNDIDLALLSELFSEVHLVDWDAQALHEGIKKQQVDQQSLIVHSGIELTGVGHYLGRWKKAAPTSQEINEVVSLLSEPHSTGIKKVFDVVLSSSLLTQLIEYPVALLGLHHPRMEEVALHIRAAHFRLMMSLMAPAGTGLLVTELISSDTCKELPDYPEHKLAELQFELIQQEKIFTGTNSHELTPALMADPFIAPQISITRLTAPWRWQLSPTRFFLAYGFVFVKK